MHTKRSIYLDNAATTPLADEVLAVMTESYRTLFGNPSSIHEHGRRAKAALEQARKQIAHTIGAQPGEIYFTSGGTEANNTALAGAVSHLGVRKIVSSKFEHPSVLQYLKHLKTRYSDLVVDWIETDEKGAPDLEHLKALLASSSPKTLVSLMHANNEMGTLSDIATISEICQDHGAIFHSDTVQTMGYYPLDLSAFKIGFLSASAHKFYGPKGMGFLYMSNENILGPYLHGGGQERGVRSGTENVAGALGMAEALSRMEQYRPKWQTEITQLRQYLVSRLREDLPDCVIEHEITDQCHYKIVNITLPPSPKSELAVILLDIAGISISGGSACSSGAEKSSPVMELLHPGDPRKHIRISLSHHNTTEELDYFIRCLSEML